MTRSGVISDELWDVIEPVLPAGGGVGHPWRDHRQVLEAICWRFRAGAPWRDVPADLVPWKTAWKRHRRWSTDGTYHVMFTAVRRAQALGEEEIDAGLRELLAVDSPVVRAHQHAAGARRDSPDTGGRVE